MFRPVVDLQFLYPPLFYRYLQRDEGVVDFYSGDFADNNTFIRRNRHLEGLSFSRAPRNIVREINRFPDENGRRALEDKIAGKETVFVITGQQPSVLGGPLYVVYKALTVIKLAREMERVLGRPVQPLFWVAGEDHNIFEMTRIFVPAMPRGGEARRVRLSVPYFGPPAGRIKLRPRALEKLLERFEQLAPEGEHKAALMSLLKEKALLSGNLSEWFINVMSPLFSSLGLVFFDPLRASAEGLYTEMLLKVVEEGALIHSLISREEEKIKAAGFPLQVERTGQESFIMIVWKGRRCALYRDGDMFFTAKGELSLSKKELLGLIREEPHLFSPNVLLRPLFQDSLFPTLSYVPGPHELAYFAQVRGVYEIFGQEMPPLYPRVGATLVEPEIGRLLQKYNLSAEEAMRRCSQNEERSSPRGRKLVPGNIVRENLWPRSRPQERVFNIFSYIISYGFTFWYRFCEEFPLSAGHYICQWGNGELNDS